MSAKCWAMCQMFMFITLYFYDNSEKNIFYIFEKIRLKKLSWASLLAQW